MSLIVAPDCCYQPAAVQGEGRVWGPSIQLYALRSQRNWGIGDFTDLKAVVESSAELGAASVGLNPLHALFPHNPNHASPYSPSSRLFFNILYLDVEAIPDYDECGPARETVNDPQFQARLRALRASELVNYEEVADAKFQILELLYRHFRKHHLDKGSKRGKAFRAFQKEEKEPLRMQALFDALQEHFHRQDPSVWGWPAWPEPYRNPASEQVAAFAGDQQQGGIMDVENKDFHSRQACLSGRIQDTTSVRKPRMCPVTAGGIVNVTSRSPERLWEASILSAKARTDGVILPCEDTHPEPTAQGRADAG
jgi:(1->4)-alpha-D-glucan 1-alpha-D-glucosylmutase